MRRAIVRRRAVVVEIVRDSISSESQIHSSASLHRLFRQLPLGRLVEHGQAGVLGGGSVSYTISLPFVRL